jgi:hypothetical protein
VRLVRRPILRRADAKLPADDTFPIVVIGRLSRRKSQIALNVIRAFEQFVQEVPGAHLSIVGGGSQLTAVRRAGREANQRHRREILQVTGPLTDPWPILRTAALVIGGGYAAMESLIHGKAILGAGFLGFGIVHADNVRQARAANFGDSAGDWETTTEAFLAAFREIHAGFRDPARRDHYCHLDRLIGEEHTIEAVSGHLEQIYQEVLTETGVPCAS